jgi:molybdate transport system substrate-binding protein
VDAFRQLMLDTKSIVFPSSTTGTYLETKLFPKLGIAEEVAKKRVNGMGGVALFKGDAEVAVQPVSELLPEAGIKYIGPIPLEIQYASVFTAAIVDGSHQADAAKRLIHYLASDRVWAAFRKNGMEASKSR